MVGPAGPFLRCELTLTTAYLLLCQGVGLGSAWATRKGLRQWYPRLRKPWFNPPNSVFGPVWTVLYVLMALAAARVHADLACRALFFLQLGLNGLWSFSFFYWRRPGLALVNVLALWGAIAWCVRVFEGVDWVASLLLWPYLAWVSFATLLNFELWRLNRHSDADS